MHFPPPTGNLEVTEPEASDLEGSCDRNVDTCDMTTNRDLTRSLTYTLPRHQVIRFKDKSERSVPLLPCTRLVTTTRSLGFSTIGDRSNSSGSVDFLVIASQTWFLSHTYIPHSTQAHVNYTARLQHPRLVKRCQS